MKKRITIKYKKRRIKIIAENCNIFEKFVGLMFSRRQKAKILLFHFKKKQKIPIHSFFVFYPFLAVWTDKKNKVVGLKLVRPFTFCIASRKFAFNLVEIPINSAHRRCLERFKY